MEKKTTLGEIVFSAICILTSIAISAFLPDKMWNMYRNCKNNLEM